MQYGSSGWADWVIDDEEEAIRHIKYACVISVAFERSVF